MSEGQDVISKFTSVVKEKEEQIVVAIPEGEVKHGDLSTGQSVKVELKRNGKQNTQPPMQTENQTANHSAPDPPVEEDDVLDDVEIVSTGDEGDGIAKTSDGFVIIVPSATEGETVSIKITQTFDTYAMATRVQ